MEDTLGELLNKILDEHFSTEQMILLLIKDKLLKEYNIELTKPQEKNLINKYRSLALRHLLLS